MLQNKNIYVSLQSQLNMVPIVQLVRASDCGSECRGFESHWAPKRGSRKTSFFRIVGSEPTGFVIDKVTSIPSFKEIAVLVNDGSKLGDFRADFDTIVTKTCTFM